MAQQYGGGAGCAAPYVHLSPICRYSCAHLTCISHHIQMYSKELLDMLGGTFHQVCYPSVCNTSKVGWWAQSSGVGLVAVSSTSQMIAITVAHGTQNKCSLCTVSFKVWPDVASCCVARSNSLDCIHKQQPSEHGCTEWDALQPSQPKLKCNSPEGKSSAA